MRTYEGAADFRGRLVLSVLSARPVAIKNIRVHDVRPPSAEGQNPYAVSTHVSALI